MAKEVTHAVKFRDPIQPEIGEDRYLLVLACDDGSLYEYQKLETTPVWSMRERGERTTDPAAWSNRGSRLPADVEDHLDNVTDGKWA